jgi:GT2 family glycosyltransferase
MNIFVVIVTYNGSKWLNKCLSSVFESSVPVQVIVVDNNSTDDSLKIVSQFPEVRTFQSRENLGFGKANNTGIQYALDHGADYIFLLNQDAWVRPDTIEHLLKASLNHPEYYVLSPLHLEGTETKLDLNFQHYISPENCKDLVSDLAVNCTDLKDVYEIRFVNAALWLLPRRALLEIGGFDPLFPHYGEDNDFIKRVNYHGHKAGICPAVFGVHDRPQRNDFTEAAKYHRSQKKLETNALIKLKNINLDLGSIAFRIYLTMFKDILTSIFRMQFSEAGKHIRVVWKTTANMNQIIKHRTISEKRGASSAWLRNSHPVNAVQLLDYSIPGELH